jgi:hypothetical protein
MTVKYLLDVHVHAGIAQGLWQRLPELVIVEARLHFPRTKDDERMGRRERFYSSFSRHVHHD